MSRIKTRENAKDIKVLDKSAAVGQRMKNAFIRSRRDAAALADDRQANRHSRREKRRTFPRHCPSRRKPLSGRQSRSLKSP